MLYLLTTGRREEGREVTGTRYESRSGDIINEFLTI